MPLIFLSACGGSSIPADGPCGSESRAVTGAEYLAALNVACPTEHTLEECEAHHPEVKKDWESKRERWVLCSRQ